MILEVMELEINLNKYADREFVDAVIQELQRFKEIREIREVRAGDGWVLAEVKFQRAIKLKEMGYKHHDEIIKKIIDSLTRFGKTTFDKTYYEIEVRK